MRKTVIHKFEEHHDVVPQDVIDLNIATILKHQTKWNVTKPDRWNDIIAAISNSKVVRYLRSKH